MLMTKHRFNYVQTMIQHLYLQQQAETIERIRK